MSKIKVGKIKDEKGHKVCSVHGDTVVLTIGQWTGREMFECSECGVYVDVSEGPAS